MDNKPENINSFFERVYKLVCMIPKGRVATYGQIAVLAGNPRASRIVGYALHVNPRPGEIPCHRVVNRFGGLAPAFAFGGTDAQRRLLEAEGVMVDEDNNIDLKRFRWDSSLVLL
jgi:methylated-DNA-protein-cysteine methyltransferase-like protein